MNVTHKVAAAGIGIAVAVGMAAPANAETSASSLDVRMSSFVADSRTSVLVSAELSQTQYADISLDITFEGFTASGTFAYRPGSCPSSLFRLNIPAEVFECGWEQDGDDARLRMAIKGTFPATPIGVRVLRKGLTSPGEAGSYSVELSSWALAPLTKSVKIKGR